MKVSTLFVIILLIFAGFSEAAAELGKVRGRVLDSKTGEPVVGAVVLIEELRTGSFSDSLGIFVIEKIPPGAYVVSVEMIGFKDVEKEIEVREDSDNYFSFELEEETVELEEVVVTAEAKRLIPEERTPAFVTVIRREDFEGKLSSLPDLLSKSSGVQVNSLGGLGSFSTVSIRASSSEQVNIYLDGILLNQALGGGVDIGGLPLSNIESIEVYKGTAPIELGGSGIGGVVNIKTRGSKSSVPGEVSLSFGSFNTQSLNWFISKTKGKWSYLIFTDYSESDNNFEFRDDNGTPYNPNDDEISQRANNDFNSVNIMGKAKYDFGDGMSLSLGNNFYRKYKGIPGISNNQSKEVTLTTLRNLSEFTLNIPNRIWSRLIYKQRLFFSYNVDDYTDLLGEVGIGRQDSHNVTKTYGIKPVFKLLLGGHHIVTLVGTLSRESYTPQENIIRQRELFESSRNRVLFGVEDEVFFGRLTFLPSFQYDRYESRIFEESPFQFSPIAPKDSKAESFKNYRLGMKIQVTDWFLVKGNVADYMRVPNFFELFGDKGAVVGNTDLKAEGGQNRDVGFRLHKDRAVFAEGLVWEVVYYNNEVDNLIQFIEKSAAVSIPKNIGKARIWGIEMNTSAVLWGFFRLGGNYTFQEAVNRSPIPHLKGKILPNRPKTELSAKVEFLLGWGRIYYEHNFEGDNFLDQANLRPVIKARTVVNLGISIRLFGHLKSTFEVKNISDNQIADIVGYPLPGRSYFITLNGYF